MMEVELLTGVVERLLFAYGVELHIVGAIVRIEGEATVGDHGVEVISFDPERPSNAAAALLSFLHADVHVELLGPRLLIRMVSSDSRIEIGPSTEYEAWSVVLADGSRFVCGPDGQVSRWSAS